MPRHDKPAPARVPARSPAAALWAAILAERRAGDDPGTRLRALLLADIAERKA